MKLRIDTDREEDGRWIADVPALPGVTVYGESREAAIERAKVLSLRVLADCLEHHEPVAVPLDNWFRPDAAADAEDLALAESQVALAAEVLEPEDFSDWPGYPSDEEVRQIRRERELAREVGH